MGKVGQAMKPADAPALREEENMIAENRAAADRDHLHRVKYFHDADASRYRADRYQWETCEGLAYVTRRQIVLAMADAAPGRVLDVGCGPGIFTRDLLQKGHEVLSADLSMGMIREARRTASAATCAAEPHFVVSDASRICVSGDCMDMVLSIGLMCYVKDHRGVLSEILRVLKPGGVAVIQVNNIRWPALYRAFVPLYRRLKTLIGAKRYDGLDFDFNFSSRKRFLDDIAVSGLQVLDIEHYDFRLPFADILLPRLSVRMGKLMFRGRHRRLCRWFSHGLLIKVRK
jgi:SAM-dependent methyltransferase